MENTIETLKKLQSDAAYKMARETDAKNKELANFYEGVHWTATFALSLIEIELKKTG